MWILVVTMLYMGHHAKQLQFGPYSIEECQELRDSMNEFSLDNHLPVRAMCKIQV